MDFRLFVIFNIFIAACLETDIYLPAFTDIMQHFSLSEEEVQKILTYNFIGLCLSGPFYGPISDAIGRRKPLLIALGLFLFGSIFTMVADNFTLLLFGRFLQGIGSGGCFTLGTAIIFDVYSEKKALYVVNKMNVITPIAMGCAPMVGGLLNYYFGFRSNFTAIGLLVLFSFFLCLLSFKEVLPEQNRKPLILKNLLQDFKIVSWDPTFWQLTILLGLLFACYLTFLSIISVLFILELGVAETTYPFFQGFVIVGFVLASLTADRAMQRIGEQRVKLLGVGLSAFGVVCLILTALFFPKNPYLITFVMLPYSFGSAWAQTPYFGELMQLFPDKKGIMASILTSARLLLTALVIWVTSILYDGTVLWLTIVITLSMLVILLLSFLYERKKLLFREGGILS